MNARGGASADLDLQERLDRMVDRGRMPGAQLGVLRDGEVTTVASGVLDQRTGQPVTTDAVFQIGSVGKLWTATAAMQLVEEGRLDLDQPIQAHLPQLSVGDPATSAGVTLRHLLTHTSGIAGDVFDDTGSDDGALQRAVDLLRDLPPVHRLGQTWSYCNAGFGIVGVLIAGMAGTTFERAIADHIARPLGIDRLAWNADEAAPLGAALGHVAGPDGTIEVAPGRGFPRSVAPAGLVTTTATDLLAFAAAHLDHGGPLLSAAGAAAMQTAQVPCPSHIADDWGLGFMVHRWGGHTVVGHAGATIGQYAELLMVPDQGVALALLVNGPRGRADHELLTEVLRDLCDVPRPPPPTPSPGSVPDPERFVGRYVRHGMALEVALVGGEPVLTSTSSGALAELEGPAPGPAPLLPSPVDGTLLVPVDGGDRFSPVVFHGGDDAGPAFCHHGARAHRRAGSP